MKAIHIIGIGLGVIAIAAQQLAPSTTGQVAVIVSLVGSSASAILTAIHMIAPSVSPSINAAAAMPPVKP